MIEYVRFQSAVPNARRTFPGVFALANGLADNGVLSPSDRMWHRAANDKANEMYADPSQASPGCYDRETNPGARSWFKSTAASLLEMTSSYLNLLDRYEVPWVQLRARHPGRIVHEDEVQVVAVPFSFEQDWRLSSGQ